MVPVREGEQGSHTEPFSSPLFTSEYSITALMLGRLRMSVPDAIAAYVSLSKTVFSGIKWTRRKRFKTRKLNEALQKIVKTATGNSDTLMMERSKCKVYVSRILIPSLMP